MRSESYSRAIPSDAGALVENAIKRAGRWTLRRSVTCTASTPHTFVKPSSLSIVDPMNALSAAHFSWLVATAPPPPASPPACPCTSLSSAFVLADNCAKFRPNLSISTPSILRFRFMAPGRCCRLRIWILPSPSLTLLRRFFPSTWAAVSASEKPCHSSPSPLPAISRSASRISSMSSAATSFFPGRRLFFPTALGDALETPASRTRSISRCRCSRRCDFLSCGCGCA